MNEAAGRPVIVDAGVGNLGNLVRALEHLGAKPEVTRDPAVVAAGECGLDYFRVFSPRDRQQWQRRTIPLRDGPRFAMLARHYRSQRSSWAGLFPETFLRLGLLRQEWMRRLDVARLHARPHAGTLLYERLFRFPHQRFAEAAQPFIERHLTSPARTRP